MAVSDSVALRRYDAEGARELRDLVQEIFESSYVEAIASGDPFESVEAFMDRFDAYSARPELDLVVAYHGAEAIGQTWGWPLLPDTGWWTGLLDAPEPGFTDEDGHRTFGLSEIMVTTQYQGNGVARILHDTLLAGRPERRASLLAQPGNTRAYRAYLHWGWAPVAKLRPNWPGAPTFDVLMRDLPGSQR